VSESSQEPLELEERLDAATKRLDEFRGRL
jgi:hypothetical protein